MEEKSKPGRANGTLYVVATPIGNLDDITLRAVHILSSVPLIACEDTRRARILLNHLKLKKTLISYYQPVEKNKLPLLIRRLHEGQDIALISDAGTPGISDPGFPLIREAIQNKIPVVPIPGVSAATAALSAAGLPTFRFLFLGFPPPKKQAVLTLLKSLENETSTLIFYLPPRKLKGFLETAREVFPKRTVVIARELTKLHEEFKRGMPAELLEMQPPISQKGEATVLIEGLSRKNKKSKIQARNNK